MTENEVGNVIIASAMMVHSAAGPGLLERAYETCLLYELENQGLRPLCVLCGKAFLREKS